MHTVDELGKVIDLDVVTALWDCTGTVSKIAIFLVSLAPLADDKRLGLHIFKSSG